MSLDEKLSGFIGRIYEAVYEPESWETAIGELLDRTRSQFAVIGITDNRTGGFQRNSFHGRLGSTAADGIQEYNQGLCKEDPVFPYMARNPQGSLRRSRQLVRGEYDKDSFIRWSESRFGTTDWIVAYAPLDQDFSFGISVHAAPGEGAHARSDAQLFRLLFGHMERAVRLAARQPEFTSSAEATVLVDRHCRVLAISPGAEHLVAHRDGIEIKAGYLTGSSAAATTALGRAVAWAGCPEGRGGGVRIPRRSGRSDYLVQAGCCPERLAHLPFAPGAAILRIYDPAQSHRLPPAITSLFDLTARETEVAQALLQGHSVDTLASALHISRNTARIHLQRLFHKTGTNRQADLVRLLTSLAAPAHSANGL